MENQLKGYNFSQINLGVPSMEVIDTFLLENDIYFKSTLPLSYDDKELEIEFYFTVFLNNFVFLDFVYSNTDSEKLYFIKQFGDEIVHFLNYNIERNTR